jgi:tRNA1(Val) A37 N6-methylase TrmN6
MTDAAPDTTIDAFLGGRVMLRQPKTGYRAGVDAVLLAAAVPMTGGDSVLDAGAGVGVVGLSIAARVPGCRVTLVEMAAPLAAIARENITHNSFSDRTAVIEADVAAPLAACPPLAALRETFDHVAANPPYYVDADGTRAADPLKDGSHAMPRGGLESWARFLASMAAPGGTCTIVHRADALPELLQVLDGRFGALIVFPIFPRRGTCAHRVLVQGRKGSRAPLVIAPGLVLHGDGGNGFTPEATAILRHGAALDLTAGA